MSKSEPPSEQTYHKIGCLLTGGRGLEALLRIGSDPRIGTSNANDEVVCMCKRMNEYVVRMSPRLRTRDGRATDTDLIMGDQLRCD